MADSASHVDTIYFLSHKAGRHQPGSQGRPSLPPSLLHPLRFLPALTFFRATMKTPLHASRFLLLRLCPSCHSHQGSGSVYAELRLVDVHEQGPPAQQHFRFLLQQDDQAAVRERRPGRDSLGNGAGQNNIQRSSDNDRLNADRLLYMLIQHCNQDKENTSCSCTLLSLSWGYV